MKKFISCLLTFVMLFTTMPVQIFAQGIGENSIMYFRDSKGRLTAYKPAMSFKYDTYKLGETDTKLFVEKLEQDLLNEEKERDPKDLAPAPQPGVYGNKWGSPQHLRESYNDFLYYNINPKDSKLWNKTALIPGNGVEKKDVLAILDHHHALSEAISYRFRQNKEYQDAIVEKQVRLIPVYALLLGIFYVSWAIAPEALTVVIPCIGKTIVIPKIVSALTLMVGLDIWLSDQVAWHMKEMDKRLKFLYESIGYYRNSMIKISANTELLRSETENPREREILDQELQDIIKNKKLPREDIKLIKTFLKKGYSAVNVRKRDRLKIVLGQFLYDVFKGDEDLIDKYVRKEMLRNYYALVFIEEELDNENDPLRYRRAMIDLATTYKIREIRITDGRIFSMGREPETKNFAENLQYLYGGKSCNINGNDEDSIMNSRLVNYINNTIEEEIGADLEDQTNAGNPFLATSYPSMLTRAQVNYLVQLMEINRQEEEAQQEEDIRRGIERRVAKRENQVQPDGWGLTK